MKPGDAVFLSRDDYGAQISDYYWFISSVGPNTVQLAHSPDRNFSLRAELKDVVPAQITFTGLVPVIERKPDASQEED